MTEWYGFGIVLAAVWGTAYALFLQRYPGRFLAARFTWLAVVIGVGVDVAIVAVTLGGSIALLVTGIVGTSAIPIVARSLWNEMRDQQVLRNGHKDARGQ